MKGLFVVFAIAIAVAAVVLGRKQMEQRREQSFRRELEELPAASL